MKKNKDAFGERLLAQYKDKRLTLEIVERDDGLMDPSHYAEKYFSTYPSWTAKEKHALKLVKGRVLDVGCGAGRHVLYLQSKGFDVTGIDNSPGAVKVCKLRGVKKVKLLPIEEVGTLRPNSFDTVLFMGNNFGLFGSAKKAREILKTLSKVTSSGARMIAENRNPYLTDNPLHLAYHKFNRSRGRMSGQNRLRLRFQTIIGDWFDYLFISPKEMETILKGTGWKMTKIFDKDKEVYIAVIEKKKSR